MPPRAPRRSSISKRRSRKVHWTRVDSRDATKTYNKMTLAELAKRAPGFDFAGLSQGQRRRTSTTLIVAQPSAVHRHRRAGRPRRRSQVLKDQLLVRSLDGYSAYLPKAFDQENFAFYGTTLNGTPEQEARWKRGVNFTTGVARRRRQQALRRAIFPARDQGRGRRAGPERHRRDGPAHRQARAG